ncbi:MAG: acyl-CoA thioesterase [Oceanicoccus sp.]|jgi:acyl-CoA thioesterase
MIEAENNMTTMELQAAPADLNESLGLVDIISFDKETSRIRMEYKARQAFCHSGGVVQGGFVTGWIDAAMAHSVIFSTDQLLSPLSLEIKVTFLKSVSPGRVFAEAWVERRGRSICFLEGQLLNEAGEILAKGTSTAKLVAIK